MPPLRPLSCAVLAALAILVSTPPVAVAASSVSGEVSGNSAAARTAVDALRDPSATAVAAGGHTVLAPMVLSAAASSAVNGVIGTTPLGTTVSVERSRYTPSASAPVHVSASTNPGTAACTNSGLSMQGNAPRPASLVGNAGCTNGTAYTESGGAGEATTRDAVTFTFSRPVWAFGAWFGDLETRTALDEGTGFVGANPVDARPRLALAIGTSAIGPVTAGTVVHVPLTVTNPGDVAVASLTGPACSPTAIAAGASLSCTAPHTVTQTELDAGGFDFTATIQGDWTGLPASATDTKSVPLVRDPAYPVALAADITDFDTIGTVITYTATITNTTGGDVVRTATATWDTNTTTSNPNTVTWVPVPKGEPVEGLASTGGAALGLGLAGAALVGLGATMRALTSQSRRRS